MKTWIWTHLLIVLISFGFVSLASAAQQGPDEIIDIASQQLLVSLNQETTRYNTNPQRLYTKILNQLRPITDVNSIAKGIMGSYYNAASATQRTRFSAAFEKSLVKIYADSLMQIGVKEFKLKPAAELMPNARRRSVNVKVITHKGDNFIVSYSMLRNKQNQWFIRNIVVDGVNFGLTYRNQFKSEMNRRGNNMDDLIAHWAQIVGK